MIVISFWGVTVAPEHSSGGQGCNCPYLQEKQGHEHQTQGSVRVSEILPCSPRSLEEVSFEGRPFKGSNEATPAQPVSL